jgi:hypothetical protein
MRMKTLAAATLFAACLAGPLAGTAAHAAPAPQQSQSDLQKEIDRLRQENEQWQTMVDELKKEIAKLKAALADQAKQAQGSAPAAPAPTAPPAPPADVVPADPSIGPGGLLAMLQAEYLSAFDSAPQSPANGGESVAFNNHLRKLEAWCARANRRYIRTFTWVGRIDPTTARADKNSASMDLLFQNGTRQFRVPVTLTTTQASRIRQGERWYFGDVEVTAVVRPKVRIDANRSNPGAFEVPPMVGPYLTYAFDYDVRSIEPAPEPKDAAPKGDQK